MRGYFFLALSLIFFSQVEATCCETVSGSRFELRYQGPNGIGYNEGYATLAGFLTPQYCCRFQPFLDVRGHIFNKHRGAANVGLGCRYACDSAIFGLNAYYDYRSVKHLNSIHQVGGGLEVLGKCVDFRLNGYVPVKNKCWKDCAAFDRFKCHTALAKQHFAAALPNIDAELGFCLPRKICNTSLYAAAGTYYLFEKKIDCFPCHLGKEWGGRARVALKGPYGLSIGGEITHDGIFKTRGSAFVSVSIPLGRERCRPSSNSCCCDYACLTQSVHRNEIIPVETKTHKFDILCTCQPGNKIYFVNNNNSGGTGTYENPFGTLIAAENASSAGDIIYVLPGDGTSKGMDSGFITKENQRLIGSAASFRLCDFCIPIMTPNMFPLIENTMRTTPVGGDDFQFGVIMKEGTEVAGLHFEGTTLGSADASVGAILDPSGSNFTIRKNIFSDFEGFGIFRETPLSGGSVKVCGNVFENIFDYGVLFAEAISDSTLCFKKNSFSLGDSTGVEFDGDFTNVAATFCENQFFETAGGVGWFDVNIIDSQITFCNNRFENMDIGVVWAALNDSVNIMGGSINFCDNQFSNMFEGVLFGAFGTGEISFTDNPIAFCNNSFQQLGIGGVLWESNGSAASISLEENPICFCNNQFRQISDGAVGWLSFNGGELILDDNKITFCNNLFQQVDVGVLWAQAGFVSSVSFDRNTVTFCNNQFEDIFFAGVLWDFESFLIDNSITFCKNQLQDVDIGMFIPLVEGGSITICENSFTNVEFGVAIAEMNSGTLCLTNNQFTNISEIDFFLGNPAGPGATDSTVCVEDNHFSTLFFLDSADSGSTSSCLRLVGNFMEDGGEYFTTEGALDIEDLNNIEAINNNQGTFDLEGTSVPSGSCGCSCSCDCECDCICDCTCECDCEVDCVDPCEIKKK